MRTGQSQRRKGVLAILSLKVMECMSSRASFLTAAGVVDSLHLEHSQSAQTRARLQGAACGGGMKIACPGSIGLLLPACYVRS